MSNKRRVVFADGEFYHIFNRTTADENVFVDRRNVERALDLFLFYKYSQKLRYSFYKRLSKEEKKQYFDDFLKKSSIVDIYAYCLMPNHFHLLLKQNEENGIKKFLSNIQNSFAKYFNTKKERHGSLFQNSFKANHIEKEEEFLHISRYIHLNPTTSFIMDFEDLKKSDLTSFVYYFNQDKENYLIDTELILKILGTRKKYSKFVENQVDYQRSLNKIKRAIND